jgi:hypothetical protein
MFSRTAGLPLAQGIGGQTFLADVSIGRKNHESTTSKFYWKWRVFSSERMVVVDK